MEGRRLSQPRNCSKGLQSVTKAVYRGGLILGPLVWQSDVQIRTQQKQCTLSVPVGPSQLLVMTWNLSWENSLFIPAYRKFCPQSLTRSEKFPE